MNDATPNSGSSGLFALGLALVAAIALGAAMDQFMELRRLRLLLGTQELAIGRVEAQLQSLGRQRQSDTRKLAALAAQQQARRNAAEAAAAQNAGAAAGGRSQQSREKAIADAKAFFAANPEALVSLRRIAKIQFESVYGPFIRSAGLNADQAARLEDAVINSWIENTGISAPGAIYVAQQQAGQDLLEPILGDAGYKAFQDYQRAMPAQRFSTQVATEAGYLSSPLTADQLTQLSLIVAGASTSYQNGRTATLDTVDWDAVLQQSNSLGLTPAQNLALQNRAANQQYQQALNQARQNQASSGR